MVIYPLPSILERLDLAKPCPHSVNRNMKSYSALLGGIGILTKSCVSL